MGYGNFSMLGLLFSHGVATALTLYLAVRGGDWLDRRLGTSPLFLALLVLLVLVANLRLLIKDILAELDRQQPPRDPRPTRPASGAHQAREDREPAESGQTNGWQAEDPGGEETRESE